MRKAKGKVVRRVARSREGIAGDSEVCTTDGDKDVGFEELFGQAWDCTVSVIMIGVRMMKDIRE